MLQLIITLDDKKELLSTDHRGGTWFIYLHKDDTRDRVEERYFHASGMLSELEEAIKSLGHWNKRIK